MKNVFHIAVTLVLTLVLFSSCAQKQKQQAKTVRFPSVQLPSMLEGAERLEYAAAHFWDGFFKLSSKTVSSDSTVIGSVAIAEVEQAMADYLSLLGNIPIDEACAAVSSFAGNLADIEEADTASNVFEKLGSLFERYAFDPNSPLRDEDLYSPYARNMSLCAALSPEKRDAYAEDVRLCQLNRRGSKAADFSFTDRRGHRYSLYGIKAKYTVLFFSNPGCTACKEIIDALSQDELVCGKIADGTVVVLNIYIDEDIRGWLDYMAIYPESWYNGFDDSHSVRDEELYNVRAIPSLYLLDSDKTVLLKDTTIERLMNTLYSYETVS